MSQMERELQNQFVIFRQQMQDNKLSSEQTQLSNSGKRKAKEVIKDANGIDFF